MHHETNTRNIAVLYNEKPSISDIEYIDGEYVQSYLRKKIFEVLPGKHAVQVVYHESNDQTGSTNDGTKSGGSEHKAKPFLVEFNALPRHIYVLIYHLGTYYSGADINDVTDEASKAVKTKSDMEKWSWAEEYINKWQLQ
jgi:hypothetical protein